MDICCYLQCHISHYAVYAHFLSYKTEQNSVNITIFTKKKNYIFCCTNKNTELLQLILELGPYIEELKKTHGAISEFVNPK
jgi:hypothetical protein